MEVEEFTYDNNNVPTRHESTYQRRYTYNKELTNSMEMALDNDTNDAINDEETDFIEEMYDSIDNNFSER